MDAKQFYRKWEIKNHNVHHYRKIFQQCIINNELDYNLMDKEFTRRSVLKEYARQTLLYARGLDIYECFSQPYAKEKACNWLVRLYMQPIDDKHNGKKLIETRTVNRINTILEHYLKGKTNE